ncbi:XtrA/YqaO family protein [Cytobacillus horneckiae]|uniref:XtrA/YqaO family protein n=1 Tax=Cytobacillus horneckiae TaxID=549687 RepID=UPI0039A36DE5
MKEAARLKTLEINQRTGLLDIFDKKGCFAIVACNGKVKLTELPAHGETKIITHQGKVKRIKFDEGIDF